MLSADREIPPPGDILLLETDVETPDDARTMERLTRHDRILARVLHWALCGWPVAKQPEEFRSFIQRKSERSVHRNCLLWGNRVIIPEKARSRVLRLLHEAHPGIVRMKALARSYVWWPRLEDDIEHMVKECSACQEAQCAPNRAPVNPWERTEKPWSRLHADFAGAFQWQVFLIVVDSYSKWLDVSPVRTTSANAVIDKLASLFATHGLAGVIVTDNGTAFTAAEFEEFAKANTIGHATVAPYHPSSNGQAERMVQTVKQTLRKIIHGSWSLRLSRFLLNQHLTPRTATGISPADVVMSRRPRSLLDNVHPDSVWTRTVILNRFHASAPLGPLRSPVASPVLYVSR
uniref:RNA-directed DNA polymerase n=1 Tax=Trichuris muris TaxID=70415 RepID=A0A5S6Q612_TRIMR